MTIAYTSLVFCALCAHARNVKKQKDAVLVQDYMTKDSLIDIL